MNNDNVRWLVVPGSDKEAWCIGAEDFGVIAMLDGSIVNLDGCDCTIGPDKGCVFVLDHGPLLRGAFSAWLGQLLNGPFDWRVWIHPVTHFNSRERAMIGIANTYRPLLLGAANIDMEWYSVANNRMGSCHEKVIHASEEIRLPNRVLSTIVDHLNEAWQRAKGESNLHDAYRRVQLLFPVFLAAPSALDFIESEARRRAAKVSVAFEIRIQADIVAIRNNRDNFEEIAGEATRYLFDLQDVSAGPGGDTGGM